MVKTIIKKEKIKTIGSPLILYTAWYGTPKKSRSNFIAESTNRKQLTSYLKKRGLL